MEELAEDISLSDCGWQLRLYSYDSSTDGSEVYKVPRLIFRRFYEKLECLQPTRYLDSYSEGFYAQLNGLQVLRLIFRRF